MAYKRAWVFVDGYNFYYWIKNSPALHLSQTWCDFSKLATDHLLEEPFRLEKIQYFTALVHDVALETSPGEGRRQEVWIEALKTIKCLAIIYGRHRPEKNRLRKEKLTDVNIAVELVLGAVQHGYDKAILLSGDTDLIPAVRAITSRLDVSKLVNIWLPPSAPSSQWQRHLNSPRVQIRQLRPEMIVKSRFPDRIFHGGKVIESDLRWRLPTGLNALKYLPASTKTGRVTRRKNST